MSPTLLARLLRAERCAQSWSRCSYWAWRHGGFSPAPAPSYYSNRRACWGDALTLVKTYGWVLEA